MSTDDNSVPNIDFNVCELSRKNAPVEDKIEKYRSAILYTKQKIIAGDKLLRRFYIARDELDQVEQYLWASKEECKEVCINYNNTLEQCIKLEKNAQLLYLETKDLQERLNISENQCKAIQSHANQLQVLVHEYETEIESLKIEKQLERSNTKECTKQSASQNCDYDTLINDLCLLRDIVLGKKKLRGHHKTTLKKYDRFKGNTDADESASECSIDDVDVFEHSIASPMPSDSETKSAEDRVLTSIPVKKLKKNINNDGLSRKTIDLDNDSDSGNEVISEDTGRGSSLACFDIEKCFNSPDYYMNNSPLSNGIPKEKKNYTDASTSPITIQIERRDTASSPIPFSNRTNNLDVAKMQKATKDIGITVNPSDFITTRNVAISPIKFKLRERATSPIRIKQQERATSPPWQHVLKETATSPIKQILQEKVTSPKQFDKLSCNNVTVYNEKDCLEINSSDVVNDNHNSDCEVENILSMMRFDSELITPFPKSPAKAHNIDNIQPSCGYVCQDAARIGEENEILKASIAYITKEILDIKCLVKNQLLFKNNEIRHTTQDCNDNNVILNSHKDDLQSTGSSENACVSISPPKNVATELNICDSHKTPECEGSLEIHKSQNKDLNYNNNLPREEIIIEDYLLKSPLKVVDKVKKTTKLTRLEKLRKKLLPKSKIRRALTPPIRKVGRRKQLLFKKNITEHSSAAAINNKAAFEKAVKVMAELKAKEKNKLLNLTENKTLDMKCDKTIVQSDKPVSRKNSIDGAFDDQNMSPENKTSSINLNSHNHSTSPTSRTTRSRSRRLSSSLLNSSDTPNTIILPATLPQVKSTGIIEIEDRRHLKRVASDTIEIAPKRILRSSNATHTLNLSEQAVKTHNDKETEISANNTTKCIEVSSYNITKPIEVSSPNITKPIEVSSNNIGKPIEIRRRSARLSSSQKNEPPINKDAESPKTVAVDSYSNDLGIFTELRSKIPKRRLSNSEKVHHPKESILCKMIEKYAKVSVKSNVKKIPETTINTMCQKLEDGIAHILSVPQNETKGAMNNFVREIQNCNMRNFLAGFMKYMKDPARKNELYNKVTDPTAPHMTKSEQVLLYILKELQYAWPSINFVQIVLSSIEFALFQLNHTPEFGTVESLSHFYAVLCRYFKAKSRLRLFILDAMYCIQFKSVALIKQCLDVWMHILPLGHLGIAKTPLVTCLVYLLHFFKCEDKFKRVQELRNILNHRYFYKVSEWTESKVLEMFKNAITELRDIPIEKKMLRMSLIILAKRRGPQWCQKHIIKKMLQPLIENNNVPERIKEFCVSILGALLKPYPNDMKVHCEIVVNQLLEMLDRDVSPRMKESIFSSLLYMRRHNPTRVTQALLTWNPTNISSDLEQLLKDYVREKPAKVWKTTLSKVALV